MNTKVSIIIPAYNTAEYIEEMLECVINQTYINIEIIIVNDGSKDSTLDIIKHFSDRDSRIVVIDVPNGGVSRARNLGLKKASGQKIFFWDSDDIIELNTIEKCLIFSEKQHVNAVLYGYSDRTNGINGEPHKSILKEKYSNDEVENELMRHFIGHSFDDVNNWVSGKCSMRYGKEHTALWRIMLDVEVIRTNNIYFDEKLSLGEDTKFINTYFLYEKSVGYLDECLYHLTIRANGANNTSNNNIKLMMNNKVKLINARLELDQIASEHGVDLHKFWEGTMVLSAIQLIVCIAKCVDKSLGYKEYIQFERNLHVKEAFDSFKPAICIKAIPFWMVKYHMSFFLYVMLKMLPTKILGKIL